MMSTVISRLSCYAALPLPPKALSPLLPWAFQTPKIMLKHIGSASNAQAAIAPEPKLLRRLCQQRLEDGVGEVGRRDHEFPALVANVHG